MIYDIDCEVVVKYKMVVDGNEKVQEAKEAKKEGMFV